jgi:hypothetical protein
VRACRYVRCCLGSRRAGPIRAEGRSRSCTWTENLDMQKTASLCQRGVPARLRQRRQRGRSQRPRQRAHGPGPPSLADSDDATAAADPEDGGRETGRLPATRQAAGPGRAEAAIRAEAGARAGAAVAPAQKTRTFRKRPLCAPVDAAGRSQRRPATAAAARPQSAMAASARPQPATAAAAGSWSSGGCRGSGS